MLMQAQAALMGTYDLSHGNSSPAVGSLPMTRDACILRTCHLDAIAMHHSTHLACQVVRQSARATADTLHRGLLASDILARVPGVMRDLSGSLLQALPAGKHNVMH